MREEYDLSKMNGRKNPYATRLRQEQQDEQAEPWLELEHIGPIIEEELFEAYDVTATQVCRDTGIAQATLQRLLQGTLPLSSEVALKLGRYFGVDPKYLLNIQTELEVRRKERELLTILNNIQPLEILRPVRHLEMA